MPEMKMRTDSARPSVASARYAPSSRYEGMPTIAPASAVIAMAVGSASQNGNPSIVDTHAEA